ncbi:MAG: pyruvate dehydrogenase (acetyl-transferring) E1 component subunit alpha [Chloroflexi bacterium]|jgi:pyruvate dehydrogenase E1 component alpha subunit|nr:pyruvate dehydrogenase (acetyl-transferring) E1 component subunit alpha [Chloroflexota bacterium]MBK6712705.1 pyruvate dehydrogenase (acetyl-transferring) E1 component subunit alpha [Chloroflexota bacterium]MBK7177851.1 pyruvate dehydrogenase (acetyl-transferring) E1 component subunit alpha [Chloroflexota bacterium]MBK7916208.1 pyruvate dehydrogenase (acetyl-transferring) E1 component subunit alpha [Chloroflexota bacterium]MBK8930809.1 pyruvate dehydrogenase (acetyl-transferring) E1 componen
MEKATLLEWYRQMVLIRRFEQRCSDLYSLGKIGGFLHLYIGQEAVAVGTIAARQPGDHVITAYRDHAHALAVGSETGPVLAELLGKATGVSKGKGGSMHLADVNRQYWGGYAVVGGHVPLATGLALAEQYKGTDNAVLCYFGDGSTNIGYFHESLNLAGVWDLPVVFVAENNQYGMGTAVERASAVTRMVDKAPAYGMEGKQVDGMDVMAVYEATSAALQAIRDGKGPQFLEMLTYRFEGHSMGDPLRYRTKDEVEKWREDDPIGILERYLLKENIADREELENLDKGVEQELVDAVQFAEESPFPAYEELFTNIYVED